MQASSIYNKVNSTIENKKKETKKKQILSFSDIKKTQRKSPHQTVSDQQQRAKC